MTNPSTPVPDLREFLRRLIERCEHGDVNAECEDLDWRGLYVDAQTLLAQPTTELEAERYLRQHVESVLEITRDQREELRDQFLALQVEILELIPPVDGERANDPAISRVRRLVTQQATQQKLQLNGREYALVLAGLRSLQQMDEQCDGDLGDLQDILDAAEPPEDDTQGLGMEIDELCLKINRS